MFYKKRIDELEEWMENMAEIQRQLLKELGYKVKWKMPYESDLYIEKIKDMEKI